MNSPSHIHDQAKRILDQLAETACATASSATRDLLALSASCPNSGERALLIQLARDVSYYASTAPSSTLVDKRKREFLIFPQFPRGGLQG